MILQREKQKKAITVSLTILFFILTIVILVLFFEQIPIENTTLAMDWKGLWLGVKGGVPTYTDETGLRYPPWSVIFILPLGLFSFRASWGLLTMATLIALIASVPREGRLRFWISAILLVLSYPSLRNIVDGNLEFLVIAGFCILLYGLSSKNILVAVAGSLLAATKLQESWILLLFLPFYAVKNWTLKEIVKAILFLFLVVVPSMLWQGREWIDTVVLSPYRGSIMDSALLTTLTRVGYSSVLSWILWSAVFLITAVFSFKKTHLLSREKMSFLICASLLLAPYAAGNNYLIVLAIGIIPLLYTWPKGGMLLYVLTNLPYFFLNDRNLLFLWSATYWTIVLLLSWGVFGIKFILVENQDHARIAASISSVTPGVTSNQ